MDDYEAREAQWKGRLDQKLGDIRKQIGNSQEKNGAKHRFKMLVDYAIRVSRSLYGFFVNVEELWDLAITFARRSSGFPQCGNSGRRAMDFACDFMLALDLVGWKVHEFVDGAQDNLSNGLQDMDLDIFGDWLQSQKLPEEQIMADIVDFRNNGLSRGQDLCTTFVGAILRHVCKVEDTSFFDWFRNALMNEGSPDRMHFGDWKFQDCRHLVGHAVKHGTVMSMPSVQVLLHKSIGKVCQFSEVPYFLGLLQFCG